MAKNKVINTVLRLRDEMSGGLVKAAKNTKGVTKEMQRATQQVVAFKNKAVSTATDAVKSFAKISAAAVTATAALAVKTGLSEAMDLEGYRLQLETATKDTQKASDIMRYAIDLANKTPFEGGQMVEAAAKFESMGMSATEWLSRAGDMAAATNKDFDQATEALIDAQTGELERLKEFGITKAMILEQGEKMFSGVQIANNSGQIVDQEKFNKAMIALMEDKFSGGMEKQATTMKGLWSTVTGVTKSALANIVGVSNDGSIRAGSALDLMKGKVQGLAERLTQWQQDGTIDRIAQQFTDGLGRAVEYAGQAFNWVTEHGDTIVRVLKTVGVAVGLIKIAKLGQDVMGAVETVKAFGSALRLISAGTPFGWVVVGITVISALIANFDKVKEIASSFFGWFKDKASQLDSWLSNSWIGKLYNGAKSGLSLVWNFLNQDLGATQGNALGTSYFRGGLTRVNERGGEIMRLPSGTQIIPHDVSMRLAGGPQVTVNVTIAGNVIGNEAYADEVGDTIVQKILRALDNT